MKNPRLRLRVICPQAEVCRSSRGHDFLKCALWFVSKNQRPLVRGAGDIQGRTYDSVRRAFDGRWQGWRLAQGSVAKVSGNRNVPALWKNGTKRNLNLNWFDNRWNDNYRFLAVRHDQRFLPG